MESAELLSILNEVRYRVRSRYSGGAPAGAEIPLPDLEPLARARDAALGKVASIGAVNPRRPGLHNWAVQMWKRALARALDWHVREQVVFNRRAVAAIDTVIETLVETNRALATANGAIGSLTRELENAKAEFRDGIHARDEILARQSGELESAAGSLAELGRELVAAKAEFAHEVESAKTEFRDGIHARDAALAELHNDLEAVERLSAQAREDVTGASRQLTDLAAHWSEWRRGWDHKLGEWAAERARYIEEFGDIRKHWVEWRAGWEHKLATNEIQFLRSVADLQAAFGHRADLMDANYRDALRAQHTDFTNALDRANADIQNELLANMVRVKADFERLIHAELRIVRQRLQAAGGPAAPAIAAAPAAAPTVDYAWFAERFRGSEERVRESQRVYLEYFQGRGAVLDIGCGRGEFLELMREAGVGASGIDASAECVAACHLKGLEAHEADLFEYLAGLGEETLDGIFCGQVVEHLPPGRLPELVRLCATRLERGGVIAMETPNPECLAIFATYFYLDPTHVRPVPRPLLEFYLRENGMEPQAALKLAPAVEMAPALATLPAEFREAFFGAMDYAVIGRKP